MNLQALFSPKSGILKKFYSGRFKHRPGFNRANKSIPERDTWFQKTVLSRNNKSLFNKTYL